MYEISSLRVNIIKWQVKFNPVTSVLIRHCETRTKDLLISTSWYSKPSLLCLHITISFYQGSVLHRIFQDSLPCSSGVAAITI